MKHIKESIKELLFCTKNIIGLDCLSLPREEEITEKDINKVLELGEKGDLGKGNHYNEEIRMGLFCGEMAEIVDGEKLKEDLLVYSNFLLVDGLVKYILFRVRKNGFLSKEMACMFNAKVRTINEDIRNNCSYKELDKYIDEYLKIGHSILLLTV